MKSNHFSIYLIALWFFVAFTFLIYPLYGHMATYRGAGEHLPFLIQGLWLLAAVVVIAELIGLLFLHPLARWLFVLVISVWSFVIGYNLQREVGTQTLSKYQVFWSLLFLGINIISVVYLLRSGTWQRGRRP